MELDAHWQLLSVRRGKQMILCLIFNGRAQWEAVGVTSLCIRLKDRYYPSIALDRHITNVSRVRLTDLYVVSDATAKDWRLARVVYL